MTSLTDHSSHYTPAFRRTAVILGLAAGLLGLASLFIGAPVLEVAVATGSIANIGKAILATSLMGVAILMTTTALALDSAARQPAIAVKR